MIEVLIIYQHMIELSVEHFDLRLASNDEFTIHVPACAKRCRQQTMNQLQTSFNLDNLAIKFGIFEVLKYCNIKSVVIYIRDY